jgi:hypothetical protein
MGTRRLAGLVAAVVALIGSTVAVGSAASAAPPDEVPDLIVVSGRARANGKTVRVATRTVEWLVERPSRQRGEMTTAELADRWRDYGYDATSPSATITADDLDVDVKLTDKPRVRSSGVTFTVTSVGGKVPTGDLGDVTVFIEPGTTSLLYVQTAERGTVAGADSGTLSVTLESVAPRTIFFSDRPDRIAGSMDTGAFASLDTLFAPDDPPNAAIVISNAEDADEDVLIVTLANPRFDAATGTFTYDATAIDDLTEGLRGWEQDRDGSLPPSFGHVVLFVDSTAVTECPGQVSWDNGTVVVTVTDDETRAPIPGAEVQLFGTSDATTPDYSGTTDSTGKVSISAIPSNALIQDYWRTVISAPGHVTLQENVTVCPDQTVDVTADLTPQ